MLESVAGRAVNTFTYATTMLVYSAGYWQRNMRDASRWARLAEASLTATGRSLDAVATLRNYEAAVATVSGKPAIAVEKSREALRLLESRYGANDPDRSISDTSRLTA